MPYTNLYKTFRRSYVTSVVLKMEYGACDNSKIICGIGNSC